MKTLNTIYLWLMLAACMLALAGCVEENVSGTGEGGNISVKMNVNARGGSDIQAEMENAVKSLRVYAFIGQKQIGYYYGEAGLNPDAGGKISFWMDLKLPPYSALEQNVWFYLVANEKAILRPSATLQENMTRDELEKFYFEEIKARGYGAVPMVARQSQKIDPNNLKESTAGGSHNGHLMWNGTVEFELERVVGNLGMYFAAKEAGMNLSIERIDFLGVLQYNYLFHPEDAVWKEVPPLDSPFELLTTSSPVTKVMTDADYELLNKKDPESIKKGFNDFFSVPVYMFENYYGSGNPNSWGTADTEHKGFVVRVTYSINGNQSVKDIYLPQVKRNTYCVVLNRIGPDDVITVDYMVADWDDADAWNDLTFEYPTYSNPVLPLDGDKPNTPPVVCYTGDEGSSIEEEGAFSVLFEMTAPENQEWTPTLLNGVGNFVCKVYQNGKLVDAPYRASPNPFTIKVIARNPDAVGQTVNFGITYSPIWDSGSPSLLMINGTQGAIAWPESGDRAEVITIRQVSEIQK